MFPTEIQTGRCIQSPSTTLQQHLSFSSHSHSSHVAESSSFQTWFNQGQFYHPSWGWVKLNHPREIPNPLHCQSRLQQCPPRAFSLSLLLFQEHFCRGNKNRRIQSPALPFRNLSTYSIKSGKIPAFTTTTEGA